MPRELTQLEQEVAGHPGVAWFREHGLPTTKDVFQGAIEAPSPRQAVRAFEEESARVMGIVTLLAKIKRDAASTVDRRLLKDLPDVLFERTVRFRWEEDEFRQRVAADRRTRGQLKVYIFIPNDEFGKTGRECQGKIYRHLREHLKLEFPFRREHLLSCGFVDDQWPEYGCPQPVLLIDPPQGITEAMRGMEREWYQGEPILITMPRNDQTMGVVENCEAHTYYDRPLAKCLVIPLEQFDATEQLKRVRQLRALGIRVWRPKRHLRAVIIKDKWGGIDAIPEELYDTLRSVQPMPVFKPT
ncbi:MAG: hypothetical protein HY437_00720 [Candidatus Magasanikbacteria bacterium]|nr:hypothetical protein [Candidatus Magasanikbacteria bacterium]